MNKQHYRKAMAISIAALFICMTFAVSISYNAEADYVNTTTVPWDSSFIPIDSAWDSTGDHCIVVGNDTSGIQPSAWYYNEPSDTWYSVLEDGDSAVPAANYIENSNTGTPYVSIQAAIDAASPGDTIEVWSGSYTENIDINVPITLIGNNSANTIIDGAGMGDVITISVNGANLYGFGVTGSGAGNAGIYLYNVINCRIENNSIYGNDNGILLEGSSNNIIKENNIENNDMGIMSTGSEESKSIFGITEYDGAYGDGVIFNMGLDGSDYDIIKHCSPGYDDGFNPYYGKLLQDSLDPNVMYGMVPSGGWYGDGAIFKTTKDNSEYTIIHNFSGVTDGRNPQGGLIEIGSYLYGMTYSSGPSSYGTVFRLLKDGSDFEVLHAFEGSVALDGSSPSSDLLYTNGWLYGMTYSGGSFNYGTIFQMSLDGSFYSVLHEFQYANPTNGASPRGSLISVGSTLYGMTYYGGTSNVGCIFQIQNDGSGFSIIHSFAGNPDGKNPYGSLVHDGTGMLYGMTYSGGTSTSYGTIFQIDTGGGSYSTLHSFNSLSTNGRYPYGDPLVVGQYLYGLTYSGGASTYGTFFQFDTIGLGFNIIHNFDLLVTNGRNPYGSLIYDGGIFYGMTRYGGSSSRGTIFQITSVPGTLSLLHSFESVQKDFNYPGGHLLQDGDMLYGMSQSGGDYGEGTIFKINKDGTSSEIVHSFRGRDPVDPYGPNTEGGYPYGNSLITDGIKLYGMTSQGGNRSDGSIFSINKDGSGHSLLHSFNGSRTDDGYEAYGDLTLDAGVLYGMTYGGGMYGHGTIFSINTDGSAFTVMHHFNATTWDGENPYGSLTLSGGILYGLTRDGGASDQGIIFQINTDSSGFTLLHSFNAGIDGDSPYYCQMVMEGSVLYGITAYGGTTGDGIIFEYDTGGGGFNSIYDFDYDPDGGYPYGSLILEGQYLYGMANGGGLEGDGTIFRLDKDTSEFSVLHDFLGSPYDGSYPEYGGLSVIVDAAAQSTANLIYHNNILENYVSATDDCIGNFWDNGLPDGGNYWGDYTGGDLPPDGIGDMSYGIPGIAGVVDPAPWMREDGWRLPYASFFSVKWDSVNGRFWLSGEYVTESMSSVYYIDDGDFTTMTPILTPPMKFTALCPDNLGNVLLAGNNQAAMWYYNPLINDADQVTEIGTGQMYGWNITDITFNPIDNRFYIVGNLMNQDKGVAFHTDQVPLDSGSANCYKDSSGFLDDKGGLKAIEWNPDKNYALAVGDGIYRLQQYDGNPGYELTWYVKKAASAGFSYSDVSWDTDGWNEAGISGQNSTYGAYWRYYHTRTSVLDGFQNGVLGTEYTTCAMKPPSSPKWLLVLGSSGGLQMNIQEKDESLEITFTTDQPQLFSVDVWKQSDVMQPDLLNSQVDPGSTYSFFIEANYSVAGVDHWNDLEFEISAWFDNGAIGAASAPFSWASDNFRTRQFNLTFSAATSGAVMNYPTQVGGVQEFSIHSVWEDPGSYGLDGNTHRLTINVTFGIQTFAADGAGFASGSATGGNIWDSNSAYNDPGSWDMQVFMYDTSDPAMFNFTYEEFGIKEHTSISCSGSPGGNGPPGSTFSLTPSTSINYTANTQYNVTLAIPDLHINGDLGDPRMIPATELSVQNIHSLAAVGTSDISTLTSFPAGDTNVHVWGLAGSPLSPPVNGELSAGPFYSDYEAALISMPFEYTIINWEINVPVGLPAGIYRGSITITVWGA